MVRKKSTAGEEEGKKVAAAYQYLGVEARDSSGHLKDAAVIVSEGAEALIKMGNSADATAAFQDAFGASALKVLPTLKDLNEEIDKQYDFLASVGALMDGNLAKASDDYNDKMHDLGSIFKGLGQDIARMMLPGLTGMADALINSATNGGILNEALNFIKGTAWILIQGLNVLTTAFIGLDNAVSMVFISLDALGEAAVAIATGHWGDVSKAWDKWTDRIVKTNVDAGAAIGKVWSNIDANPQSKEDFKKPKNPQSGGKYDPFKEKTGPKVEDSEIVKDLLKEDKAIIKLQGSYAELLGAVAHVHAEQTQADIDSGKYNAKYNEKGELIKKAATAEQIAALKSKAAMEDELELRNKIVKAQLESMEVVKKSLVAADAETTANKIRLDLAHKFGTTQDDVNQAVAQYNFEMAQKALADGIDAKFSEEKLIKLREEVALMKIRADTAATVNKQNKTDAGPQDGIAGFTNGWSQAFEKYKLDAQNSATAGADAFKAASSDMGTAFANFVTTGKLDFKSLTASILSDIAKIIAEKAIANAISMFANGGAFVGGVQMFAEGGVVSTPTAFGMAGGRTGVMGEAGPEAIMPLKRGANGKLGVAVDGGTGSNTQVTNYNMSVSIGQVSNQDDKADLLKQIDNLIESKTKKTINNEMRQGGMLAQRRA
jgi:lambda family phage tail tape measure protein